MSIDASEAESELSQIPVPSVIVAAWLSLLEGVTAAGLAVFTIALLERGGLIPDILAEFRVGFGVFVVVAGVLFIQRVR